MDDKYMASCRASKNSKSVIQPWQNFTTNNINILISLSKQQRMHHPVVNLYSLVFTFGLFIQSSAHIRISHSICTAMKHNKWKFHLTQFLTQVISNPQKLNNSTQSWFPLISQRIHCCNNFLFRNFHRLVQDIWGRYNRQGGKESGKKCEDLRNWPSGSDIVWDFTHGCHQNSALKWIRVW